MCCPACKLLRLHTALSCCQHCTDTDITVTTTIQTHTHTPHVLPPFGLFLLPHLYDNSVNYRLSCSTLIGFKVPEKEREGGIEREGETEREGGVLGGMERETKRQSHAHKSRQSVKPGSSAQPARNATAPQWETKSVSAVIDRKWDILPSSSNSWQWRLLCVLVDGERWKDILLDFRPNTVIFFKNAFKCATLHEHFWINSWGLKFLRKLLIISVTLWLPRCWVSTHSGWLSTSNAASKKQRWWEVLLIPILMTWIILNQIQDVRISCVPAEFSNWSLLSIKS